MPHLIILKMMLIWCAMLVFGGGASCSPPPVSLDPFPDSVLNELALRQDEVPPGYALITDTNLVEQAGLVKNPDYLIRRADLEDAIQMDAAASFLALYGPDEAVRLMVKGVFFRQASHAEKYAEVQSTRQRLVMAYRKDTPDGIWMLFVACDPDLTYDEHERSLIAQGLNVYQKRLALSELFDQINGDHVE